MVEPNERWSLERLGQEVVGLLKTLGIAASQPDGRVSAIPDTRTIRYYQTLGLIDRPEYEGREARYRRRHALQIAAVKLLQSASLPLAEVQARLYGKTDEELEALLRSAGAHARKAPPPRPVTWREVTVEPGVRLLVAEGWSPGEDRARILERIDAALAALAPTRGNGGSR